MARPPLPPRFHSPSIQSFCSSEESFITVNSDEDIRSQKIQEFFESFDAAERFSQVDVEAGRGVQLVREMHALLLNVWMRRDELNPQLCFDKHDGRSDRTIYHPPQRQPGGIVMPGRLAGAEENGEPGTQSVNIVHNHVSIRSEQHVRRDNVERNLDVSSKRRKIQSTLHSFSQGEYTRKRNQGKFVRKSLVPITARTTTAASIPLAPGGIREILRHWVLGDSSKALETPLSEFTFEMINAQGPTGKSHKSLYSKRRTVSVGILLALREAHGNRTSLANVLRLSNEHDISTMSTTNWEKYARQYLREGRKMSRQEIIDLGKHVYKKDYLDLLPK